MQRPPSTSRATPVIKLASSEHKKSEASAMSFGVENLPSGIVVKNFSRISGVSWPRNDLRRGVSPATGLMAFTLIPWGANSTAILFVAVIIHPFDALYQVKFGRGEMPAVEAMLRITPDFCLLKNGTIRRAVKKTDFVMRYGLVHGLQAVDFLKKKMSEV